MMDYKYRIRTFQLIVLFSLSLPIVISAQENSLDRLPNRKYEVSTLLFDKSLYGLSMFKGDEYSRVKHPLTLTSQEAFKVGNDFQLALSNLRLGNENAEYTIKKNIILHKPSTDMTPGLLALGSYYYNQKQYKKAVATYESLNTDNLPSFDLSEANFKKAYSHFIMKEFEKTKSALEVIKDIKNDYYYPSNYYYGISDYFLGNYDAAVQSFQKVKASDVYRSFVPYYITQIYFVKNQPEKVIANGEVALKDSELRNRKEIRLLLGQSYFKRKEYESALPHLEYYEKNTEKLTIDEFYQLGFTQYQLKDYEAAVSSFKEISLENTKLGQVVNYYMADCYYRLGDLVSARATFKKVSNMSFNIGMQEEATFNYGKLSAEAGFEREAINTLIKLDKKSPYYDAAGDIINDLLENTSDYASAISIIEGIKEPSNKMKNTYQLVALKNGMLLQSQGENKQALDNFNKSLKYKSNKVVYAQALYWKGQILNKEGDYKSSIITFDEYFEASNGINSLPEESSQAVAHYTQGYNLLEHKQYKEAEISFKRAVTAFEDGKWNNAAIQNNIITDAYVRTGDCAFKGNDYKSAINFYNKAINRNKGSFVYAIYQKAIIEGLMDEPYDKILTLKEITSKYPTSEYVDDAYYQLGETYLSNDNTDNAYNAYNDLVQKHNKSPLRNASLIKLGLIAYNKGDLNSAIAHYKGVMSSNPTSKDAESALLGLREIYINDLGTPDEYIAFTNNIPGYQVTSSEADSLAYSVGEAKYHEGDYEKAIAGFNNYIDKYPSGFNRLPALYFRAESSTLLKKYSQALTDYEAVSNAGPSTYYVPSLKKAAIIAYNHSQSFEKSLKYYDLYLQNTSDPAEQLMSHLGIMRSAFKSNNNEKMKASAQVVSENASSTKEDKAAAYYYLAKANMKAQEFEAAKTNYKKVESLIDNMLSAEARYAIADITYQQSKLAEAEKLINSANDKNTAYPYWVARGVLLLSDIYVKKNDLLLARAACEAVIENFSEDKQLSDMAVLKLKQISELEQKNSRIKPKSGNTFELTPSGKN